MAYGKKQTKTKGKKTGSKFGNSKFIMMQMGTGFINDEVNVRFKIGEYDGANEYTWSVREKEGREYKTTHYFGQSFGMKLLVKALQKGKALNMRGFEKDDDIQGNVRVDVYGVATKEELAAAKQAAMEEMWEEDGFDLLEYMEGASPDDEEEQEDEEEPPVRKPKAKAKTTRYAKKLQEEPEEEEEALEEDDEDLLF